MVKGVSDQFLKILANERREATRRVAIGLGVAVLALFVANLADEPLFGRETVTYTAALLAGLVAGSVWAWRRSKRLESSLKEDWNAWMRFSVSCTRVDEVYRKAANRPVRSPAWASLAVAALFVLNALLFALLWIESAAAGALGVPVVLADGLAIGGAIGGSAFRFTWARTFTRALEDLLKDGSIGIWGER